MCGRADMHRIAWAFFGVRDPGLPDPGYNVPPTRTVRIIRRGNHDTLEVVAAAWDLRPPWRTRDQKAPLHNARSETVHRLPLFRDAFRRRRCIVPAAGFFEWRRNDRQPFYFCRHDANPLAMAGIYEVSGEGSLSTCILTTTPNAECAAIHNRMPVVLRREFWARWLEPGELDGTTREVMLQPARDGLLASWPVDRAVGNVRNDHPGLIEPLPSSGLGESP